MNIETMLSNKELRDFIFSDNKKNLYIGPRKGFKTLSLVYKMFIDSQRKDKKNNRQLYISPNSAVSKHAMYLLVKLLKHNNIKIKLIKETRGLSILDTVEIEGHVFNFTTEKFITKENYRGHKFSDYYIDEPDYFTSNFYDEFLYTLGYLSCYTTPTYNFAGSIKKDAVNMYNLSADFRIKRFYNEPEDIGYDKETINKLEKETDRISFMTEILVEWPDKVRTFKTQKE